MIVQVCLLWSWCRVVFDGVVSRVGCEKGFQLCVVVVLCMCQVCVKFVFDFLAFVFVSSSVVFVWCLCL